MRGAGPLETDSERLFRCAPNLAIDHRSCFILTAAGFEAAVKHVGQRTARSSSAAVSAEDRNPLPQMRPQWDEAERTLYWRGRKVKHYRLDAPNQEFVLKRFQARSWDRCVKIVLPEDGGGSYKERLHDTIKHLNRSVRPVLRFRRARTCGSWEPGQQLTLASPLRPPRFP